jgi:hypothetical protein
MLSNNVLLLLLLFITFMQGIYNYIPETNHVSRAYSVATMLYLQFMVHVIFSHMLIVLYFYISRVQSSHLCAVPHITFFNVFHWFCAFLLCCSDIF